MKRRKLFNFGFTLIELLIAMGIIAIISAYAVVNLIRPQTKATLDTTVTTLITDLKSQQIKAMVGESEGASAANYGINLETTRYTLFKGNTFNVNDSANFVVNLEGGATLSTTFSGNTIIFARRSGEIGATGTVTIFSGSENKTLNLNQLGNLSIN